MVQKNKAPSQETSPAQETISLPAHAHKTSLVETGVPQHSAKTTAADDTIFYGVAVTLSIAAVHRALLLCDVTGKPIYTLAPIVIVCGAPTGVQVFPSGDI